ncbi:MAG: hypothetical protein LCH77_01445 [Actinobacteria bacterium]|nr:hypothetical protein [Actinomycetota bacterium]
MRDHVVTFYVDHRFGDALKIAAVMPRTVEAMKAALFVPGIEQPPFEEVSLAEAGAKSRHAMAQYLRFEDEMKPTPNWPAQRDLVEMLLRTLPKTAAGPSRLTSTRMSCSSSTPCSLRPCTTSMWPLHGGSPTSCSG